MELLIKPSETLFFRDAKPMAAGEGYGRGCSMPMPNILYSAIRTAILRNEDGLPVEKKQSRHTRDKEKYDNRKIGLDKYGSLQLKSLFPFHNKHGILFPIPNDVLQADAEGCKTTALGNVGGKTVPLATAPPSKDRVTGFWTESQLNAYLGGNKGDLTPVSIAEIWQPEWRVGVEIDPASFANKHGQLYAGEYMRMTEEAAFVTDIDMHEAGLLEKMSTFTFGGERKLCTVQQSRNY